MTGLRVAAFLALACMPGFAGSWNGLLVNAKCYGAKERNVRPTDTLFWVDRDRNEEVWYCSPNAKTKLFAIVQLDGSALVLDPAGNAKFLELLRQAGKKSRFPVTVAGELTGNTIKVDSISLR